MRKVYFVLCSALGYVIGHYLLSGAAAAYASVLISYHLYLFILVMLSQREKGIALPIGHSLISHLAFLALVVGLPAIRDHIPFFGIITLFIPALAPFEVEWLFSKDKKMDTPEPAGKGSGKITMKKGEAFSIDDLINRASAGGHEIFLAYLRQPSRTFSKPGRSVREEYGHWLADRKKREPQLPS